VSVIVAGRQSQIERRTPLSRKRVVEIDFAELSDGSLVEMIEDPADATKTLFAVYENHLVRYTDRVADGSRILVPLPRADKDLRLVCLAAGVEPCGQTHELISAIVNILGDCLDLDLDSRNLMSAFAISTWFADKLTVVPYLALVGRPGSGKTAAMLILNSLVYRGLPTADISSPAFYDISDRIRPTISLDETLTAGRPRELMHLLRASSTRGFACLRKGTARVAFGPKVFSWLELPDDQALNSRCIIIPMHKTWRTDLSDPNDPKIAERAKRLRMRLLHFRFTRFRNACEPNPLINGRLSGRPLDLYRALALPIHEYKPFCKYLAIKIGEQDKLQESSLSPTHVLTIAVLYRLIHDRPEDSGIPLKGLAAVVNQYLERRGEPLRLNERKLGNILTSLSFTGRTRQNTGYFLWLDREDRERIHRDAYEYIGEGVFDGSIQNCPTCAPLSILEPATPPPPNRPHVETQRRTKETSNDEGRVRREFHVHQSRRPRFRANIGNH
jgi:hypothetical protein